MTESRGNFADETTEMLLDSAANANTELRKRRSTRIVQAVPLVVTGVDALGRPFVERTSSLIINCHGCRYQSKHYVLKNMWVTLEIPHPETGQLPRKVRGRVAWIQRPRTVRQLFQVALELEVSGNVWGIAFPPEDWFVFPGGTQDMTKVDTDLEAPPLPASAPESEIAPPLTEAELPTANGSDNLRVFPSVASPTDASLQLARQVARLVADAKQQIQAATREAATQAVSAERRVSFEEWEQSFAARRAEITDEASRAIEKFRREADEHSRASHAAAAEAMRAELPKWLAPQLEQLTRELTARLAQEAAALRDQQEQRLENETENLKAVCQKAEEATAELKSQTEQAGAQIAARAEEAAKQQEESAVQQREALGAAAQEIQKQVAADLAAVESSLQGRLAGETEAARERWRDVLQRSVAEAQDHAAGLLNGHVSTLLAQLREETARHAAVVQELAASAASETQQRTAALRDVLNEQSQRLESTLRQATEASARLEHHHEKLAIAQQQAVAEFQAQIENVLGPHRDEIQRRSQTALEEMQGRIRANFEEASSQALAQFAQQIEEMKQPHIVQTEEALHRLAGGRSLLDAALALHQDRIRTAADEAFGESLARFRENLGSVEQLLQESSHAITFRSLTELEGKAGDLKHEVVEELFKSAEWYEKKAQTQIQNQAERATEETANKLREKAGEISGVFASELDHSSRNFVGHTQTQMEEVVRDAFERARALFTEAADTTSAAFTDEIQRTGRQELDGFNEEARRVTDEARARLEASRQELAQMATAEQEGFLRRFRAAMAGALEAGLAEAQKKVSEGFGPLLESWKSMTDTHHHKMQGVYNEMGEQAAEQYKNRLESFSNQWILATAASLNHQSQEMISGIAVTAEEKLREVCAQVFAGVGESLRERLKEMGQGFAAPSEAPPRAKGASTAG